MCQCIEKVFQLAIATFSKKTPKEIAKKNLDLLIAQTNKLTHADVGLEHCSVFNSSHSDQMAPVTYIPVVENQHISMGIFVIREGQNIPLHDHPNMHGIIKCIAGKLNVTSYTKLVRSIWKRCDPTSFLPGQQSANSREVQKVSQPDREDEVRTTVPCGARQASHS